MLRKNIVGLLICIATLGVATLGFAGIPDLDESYAVTASGAAEVNVFLTPDGTGYLMTEARMTTTAPGLFEDATITVTLLDEFTNPVFAYAFEDIWLETSAGGLVACPNGTLADASTDINGETTFTGPFYAGGHVDRSGGEGTLIVISGAPLNQAALPILFNSADITGDGVWNLDDVNLFSQNYGGAYDYGVDFFFDDVNDLSDLVLFSGARNVACP